ncbi:AC66 [Orgyia pseudotsugata single capsid nuclopolyhedrovirus]|nr:AC66 [Orgyia pseudotsugata single capsid nuclopolyhedrovirus]
MRNTSEVETRTTSFFLSPPPPLNSRFTRSHFIRFIVESSLLSKLEVATLFVVVSAMSRYKNIQPKYINTDVSANTVKNLLHTINSISKQCKVQHNNDDTIERVRSIIYLHRPHLLSRQDLQVPELLTEALVFNSNTPNQITHNFNYKYDYNTNVPFSQPLPTTSNPIDQFGVPVQQQPVQNYYINPVNSNAPSATPSQPSATASTSEPPADNNIQPRPVPPPTPMFVDYDRVNGKLELPSGETNAIEAALRETTAAASVVSFKHLISVMIQTTRRYIATDVFVYALERIYTFDQVLDNDLRVLIKCINDKLNMRINHNSPDLCKLFVSIIDGYVQLAHVITNERRNLFLKMTNVEEIEINTMTVVQEYRQFRGKHDDMAREMIQIRGDANAVLNELNFNRQKHQRELIDYENLKRERAVLAAEADAHKNRVTNILVNLKALIDASGENTRDNTGAPSNEFGEIERDDSNDDYDARVRQCMTRLTLRFNKLKNDLAREVRQREIDRLEQNTNADDADTIAEYNKRINEMRQQIKRLENDNAMLQRSSSTITDFLSRENVAIGDVELPAQLLIKKYEAARAEMASTTATLRADSARRLTQVETESKALAAENVKLAAQNAANEERIATHQSDMKALIERVERAEANNKSDAANANVVAAFNKQLEEMRARADDAAVRVKRLEAANAALSEQLLSSQRDFKPKQKQTKKFYGESTEASSSSMSAKEVKTLRSQLFNSERFNDQLQQDIQQIKETLERTMTSSNVMGADFLTLTNKINSNKIRDYDKIKQKLVIASEACKTTIDAKAEELTRDVVNEIENVKLNLISVESANDAIKKEMAQYKTNYESLARGVSTNQLTKADSYNTTQNYFDMETAEAVVSSTEN